MKHPPSLPLMHDFFGLAYWVKAKVTVVLPCSHWGHFGVGLEHSPTKSTKICNSLAFYTGSHTCHSCMTANWNYFSKYYYCLRSSHKYSYIYRVHAPRILFLRELGKTKAFSTTKTVGNASSFSTFIFLRIQIHTTWSHFYHLTVAFHSAVQWGYADWRGKGWVRTIDQELPCEAQMKKLEKGEKNICDLITSLHRAESSKKFI